MVAATLNRDARDFPLQGSEGDGNLGRLRHVGEIVPLVLAQYGDLPRPASIRLLAEEPVPLVTSETAR